MAANYTVVDAIARDFPPPDPSIDGEAKLTGLAARLGLDTPEGLCSPHLGTPVRTARSSWVRRVDIDSNTYFIKTYVYRTAWERCRGALRNTGPWRPSRAAREAQALAWMQAHDFPVPSVFGAFERRRLGFVTLAVLVTAAVPGAPLDRWLPHLTAPERARVAAALGRFVGALHARGFRDRNLDLRNLIGRFEPADDGREPAVALCKIDSPRFRLVRPGHREDRWSRADWARLLPQLQPFGLDGATRAAGR